MKKSVLLIALGVTSFALSGCSKPAEEAPAEAEAAAPAEEAAAPEATPAADAAATPAADASAETPKAGDNANDGDRTPTDPAQ